MPRKCLKKTKKTQKKRVTLLKARKKGLFLGEVLPQFSVVKQKVAFIGLG